MDSQGPGSLWLGAYTDEYMKDMFYKHPVHARKTLGFIREFLRTEKPNRTLIDDVVEFGDVALLKVYEDYLDRETLEEVLNASFGWPYEDPIWFYELLVKVDGDISLFFNRFQDVNILADFLEILPVTEENAKNVGAIFSLERENKIIAEVFVKAKAFLLAYPEFFDVDYFTDNLYRFYGDEEVLNFAITVDGIFEKEMEPNVYLNLVSILILVPTSEEILNIVATRLQEYRDYPSFIIDLQYVYYFLAQIEYQLPNSNPARFMAYLMKAGDAEDAISLRKRYFQEKYLQKSISEPLPDVPLDDDVESLVYLLNLIK